MSRKPRHFIYELYLALADANGKAGMNLTEQEGRQKIKVLLPNFANLVDPIIEAGGDLAKIPASMVQQTEDVINREDMQLTGHDEMNRKLRDATGRFARPDEGRGDNRTQNGNQSINDLLRQGRQSIPADASAADMNAALRRNAGLATG